MFSFPKWFCKFTAPPEVCGRLSCAISLQYLVFFILAVLAVLLGVLWHHISILVCISLVTNEVEYFSDVYWPFGYPLLSSLFKSFVHYFYWIFFFLSIWRSFFVFFSYSKCESFVEHVLQMLLPICRFCFYSANNVFWWIGVFILLLSSSFIINVLCFV